MAPIPIRIAPLLPHKILAASVNGAAVDFNITGLTRLIIAIALVMYIIAATNVPKIVAMGIVLVGFLILPAGMDAHSKPKKAHKVKPAVLRIAEALSIFDGLIGVK